MGTSSKRRASRSPSRDSRERGSSREGSSAFKKKSKVSQPEETSKVGFRATHLPDTRLAWLDFAFLSKLGRLARTLSRKDLLVVNVYALSPRAAKTIGGDILCLSPLAELIHSVWNIPTNSPIISLRSIASTHRRCLLDVTEMDSKFLKEIPTSLVKLGEGLGITFERFTQPSRAIYVSVESNPWQRDVEVREALLGLSFVGEVEGVKQIHLKDGNPTARFTARLRFEDGKSIKIPKGGGGIDTEATEVVSLKVDDRTELAAVPERVLLECKTFYMTARVGWDQSTIVIRRVLECSFCSSNEHLHEDCSTRINLLSSEVGLMKVEGWNTPVVELTNGDEDDVAKSGKGKPKRVISEARKKRERERQREKRAAKRAEK